MVVLDQVTFRYPNHEPVFERLNWHVEHGDAWAVLGPSGGGKTTLLYLLAGLLQPGYGAIYIDGKLQRGPRPRTGLILQDYGLLPWATAYKNVNLGLEIRRFYGPDGKHAPEISDEGDHNDRVNYWINRLELRQHREKFPSQLSGGQRQRVAIARTLSLNPDLLLMDEPFSSLDAPTRERLQTLTFELKTEVDLTTIIVTHSIEEAVILGKKILVLSHPPNKNPLIVENEDAGDPNYGRKPEFYDMCTLLRRHLENPA